MREACIILPSPQSAVDADKHETMLRTLTKQFGGCTVTEGRGAWRAPDGHVDDEAVSLYSVAMEPTEWNDGFVYGLAVETAAQLAQAAVFIRYANGNVDIANVEQAHVVKAATAAA